MIILLLACESPSEGLAVPAPEPQPQAEPLPPLPPDPCRHSVLEQRSPAELTETSGDAECSARVDLWQNSERFWAASADLDGDAQSEVMVLLTNTPALSEGIPSCPELGCVATLVVGDEEAVLRLPWAAGSSPSDRELRLIDIDTTDRRQELLVRHRAADTPDHVLHIFTLLDNQLTQTTLKVDDPSPEGIYFPGNGRVGLDASDCAHRSIRWHRLDGARLVPSTEELALQPSAAEFLQPDGGYRCPE